MRTGLGLGLLFGMVLGGGLHAQSAEDYGRLKPGQLVRVSTIGKSRFVARLGGIPGDSTSALFAGADMPFEAARVDSLWVRGHATVTGAIVGAAFITPLSFLAWAGLCELGADGAGCDQWGLVTGLALGTGAVGALLGAGVGALVPKWKLRYARQREAAIAPLVGPGGRIGLTVRF